jgi:F-type H+-transporting ATPase subunit b
MEETLHALGGLLLKALPTFILVVVLHFYMKRVFFRPMDKVLQARHEATEGARKLAQTSLDRASEKTAEYEAGIRAARSDMYKEQEENRRKWRQEQAGAVKEARGKTGQMVKEAKAQLAVEVADAKEALAAESDRLAGQIAESILGGRPN